MILDYLRYTRILSNSTIWNRFICLFIYLFIYLFVYLFICFVRKLKFLPLLKPLKMNSFEFSDIFERARQYLSCFNGQILPEAGM